MSKQSISEAYKETPMYKALVDVSKEFEKRGIEGIEFNVVGGFAMITGGYKDSYYTDIDYVGEKAYDDKLDKMIDKIGAKHGLPAGWLNNDLMLPGTTVKDLEISTGKLRFYPAFDLGNIKVNILDGKDLLRMKVISVDTSVLAVQYGGEFSRAKDLPDIAALMKRRNMTTEDLKKETRKAFPDISEKTFKVIEAYQKIRRLDVVKNMVENSGRAARPPITKNNREGR